MRREEARRMWHPVGRSLRLLLVVALAGVALVVVSPPAAQAAGTTCQRTFVSGTLDKELVEPFSLFSAITVPADGLVVADVDVSVNIHHTDTQDLSIALRSVGGGRIRGIRTLFFEQGLPDGDNLLGTTFDDEAAVPVAEALAPFTGRFQPLNALSTFDGEVGGFYQLNVVDNGVGDSGTWNDWSLTLTYRSCDFDADGVEDHVDQCRGVTARTASGCPLASRTVRAAYRAGKFRGTLSSRVSGCEAARPVSVFRVRRGPDRAVGTTRTRADGSWRLTRKKRPGRYYARSARVVVPDVAECPAVRSRTFRIG